MKVYICLLLVIAGMADATIGLLFGRGGGAQHQQEERIVKHLHRHEIKIIHEGADHHEGGGHAGSANDAQIVLLEGLGGGSAGHAGFGHNAGVFNGGGHFSNFGGGHGVSYGSAGGIAHGSSIIGPAAAQLISIVDAPGLGNLHHGVNRKLGGGFTGSQIVGFLEEGHARGFGGGHSHGVPGGFTAPQLVEFVEEGHARGFGGGHSHGADEGFSDAQIVQFVEEGHSRGFGGGHAHGRDRLRKFNTPEIAGFVEDGLEHGFGGRHSHGGSGVNGDLTSILGLLEDEHNNGGFSHSGGGEQILQVLHGDGHQHSINQHGRGTQHIIKIIREDQGQFSHGGSYK